MTNEMLPQQLIAEAQANGIRLIVSPMDRLRVSFRGCDHTDLLRLIAEHQGEIVEILKARADHER